MPVRSDDRSNFAKFGMIELGDEHGRHAVQRRAFLPLDGLQRRQRIEALAGIDHGRAERDARRDCPSPCRSNDRAAPECRCGRASVRRIARPTKIAVVEDVVVRQRHALGRAGGAAGELDVDGIVELQRLAECRERSRWRAPPMPRDVLERDRAGQRAGRRSGSPRATAAAAPRCSSPGVAVASSGSSVFSISM